MKIESKKKTRLDARYAFRCTNELRQKLEGLAAKNNITASNLITQILTKVLSKMS